MKKSSLLFALLALSNLNVLSQGLNDVYSSGGFVFAVGTGGIILKSSNAGNTYTRQTVGNTNLYSVHGVNNKVWSVGDNGVFNFSADYGSIWSSSNITSSDLKSVFFVDSLTGFIAGKNGVILKSTNGGNNWLNLTSGTSSELYKVKFINSSIGFVCGANGTMLKTTDGGASWIQIAIPVSTNINSFDVLNEWIIAGTDNSTIITSTNAGQSWALRDFKIYSRPKVNCINITAQNSFLVTFESGSIWYSTNRGSSFNYSRSPFLDELNSVSINSSSAYAVSKKHIIVIRSLDNGVNWQLHPNATYSINFQDVLPFQGASFNKIFDINYQKRSVVYACQRNKLYRSLNTGLNWSQISTLPFNYACQQLLVSMKDSAKMIVVLNKQSIDTGIVYRTSNYGLNWSKVYQGSWDYIGNLITQDQQHPETVYLGANDSVMKSTDFGLTWIKIANYPFNDFCDIAVHTSNSEVLYVSTNGFPARMHKSTNGGYNWFMIDFVAYTNFSEMPAIAVSNLNPNIVFHAQLGGGALQTGL
ncbi:MAG: YCF48-related protein [Chlorobi bacterium]|nr:YCF48-related protein [Chlorobiota bacterium]MCI0717172.1 YCF48-related protein [Chlorobiota bacterium]